MTWNERIDRAEKLGYFLESDGELAIRWVTCACGEQDNRIPRCSVTGGPEDSVYALAIISTTIILLELRKR
jgi:hypothetical protein